MKKSDSNNLATRIEKIFMDLLAIKSDTGTTGERDIEAYLYQELGKSDYFHENPEKLGMHPLKRDFLERSIIWGLVKGKGKRTIVLLHHHDVVDTFDYGILKDHAYNPIKLADKLKHVEIADEVKKDLEAGEWVFARGAADMKAGAAIQMALVEEYAKQQGLEGNILIVSVPDEESLSTGMREGAKLLKEIKKKFDLEYVLLVNSEAHQRDEEDKGIFYEGSVGKLMPVIYVRGKKTHIGDIFHGFNPIVLLSQIVANTELNTAFSDVVGDEVSPPPSWSFCRDTKKCYDASIPEASGGYFSILTLTRTPREILAQLQKVCDESFGEVIDKMNENYSRFLSKSRESIKKLPWSINVKTFSEIYEEAIQYSGDAFLKDFEDTTNELIVEIQKNKINIPESNFVLIEKVLEYVADRRPIVVIAISPPYYPHIANKDFKKLSKTVEGISKKINDIAQKEWKETYNKKNYFMGISDMSYAALHHSDEVIPYIGPNMPLWEKMYDIPFEAMRDLSIPVINLGPWGKDLHKFTERVHMKDVLEKTPVLLDNAIKWALSET